MKYKYNQRMRRRWPLVVGGLGLLLAAGAVAAWLFFVPRNPVPADVKKAVSFPIYYPEKTKLPQGYMLDETSFTSSDQVVMYTISYGSNQKLLVSVQKRPSDDDIAGFYKNTIPIRREVLTLNGEAAISAIQDQTIVSLPTNDSSWIIVMGPSDVNRDELSRVMQAMVKG